MGVEKEGWGNLHVALVNRDRPTQGVEKEGWGNLHVALVNRDRPTQGVEKEGWGNLHVALVNRDRPTKWAWTEGLGVDNWGGGGVNLPQGFMQDTIIASHTCFGGC